MQNIINGEVRNSPHRGSPFFLLIEKALSKFDPITLEEMDHVMLFDRFDQKFLLPENLLPIILNNLTEEYYALEVKQTRIHTYHTRYFDTTNFNHYLDHHNLRKSRFKFRHRVYLESDLHFFEIKEKNNKDRTVKSRVNIRNKIPIIGEQALQLIELSTPHDGKILEPKLWSNFHRLTLVHKIRQERMTIDLNLILENDLSSTQFSGTVILELKQDKKSFSVPVVRSLINNGCRPGAMSKYTMGVVELYPENKSNLFLPTKRIIQKFKQL